MGAPSWTLPELVAEVATRIAALPAPKNGQVRAIPDERTVRYYVTLGLLARPSAMRGRTALYGEKHVAQVVAIKRLQTMGRSLSEIQELWPTLDDPTLARMSGVALPVTAKPVARAEFWKREPARRDAEAITAADAGAAAQGSEGVCGRGPDDAPPSVGSAPLPGARIVTWGGPRGAPGAAKATPGMPVARGEVRTAVAAAGTAPAAGVPGAVELRIELAPHVVLSLSVTDESVVMSSADVRAIRAAAAPLLAELVSRRLTSHPGGEEP